MRGVSGRRILMALGVLLAAVVLAAPASAQSTGMVRGKVVDGEGKPVEAAKVLIEFQEGVTRKHETKSNRRGEFMQIGLAPGRYKITAEKEGVGAQSYEIRVSLGRTAEVNFVLTPAAGGAGGAGAAEMADELKKVFEEGVTLSRAGQYDEAIAKFNEALAITDRCFDCHYNIGVANAQKKDYASAEASFKKALEIKPDYAEAYNGLANIYNAQKRFDEATAASAEADKILSAQAGAGGVSAEAVYNQGIILWNAGKIAEAKQRFQDAVTRDPNHADAHYWLGMANINEGKLPDALVEMDAYLKLAPNGQYAAQAKGILAQLKK